ncbi:hypothetical protein RJ55_00107 [Drechmeria coniospora]|nr:hypothetical protein RJ55_00107 [Drechmeria coniospora]
MEAIRPPIHRHVDLGQSFNAAGPASGLINTAVGVARGSSPRRAASSRKRVSRADADHAMSDSPTAKRLVLHSQQDGPRDFLCLCTPAPKIPRPRNAFILYRQHHQARVTADNPKLSNPDISKIIGEMWGNESHEVKSRWKALAEEEKQRHQSQYPNYRYQPRRGNKPQAGWGTTSPTEEHGRCQKCGGRTSSTPHTPSTPFATSPAGNQGQPGAQGQETDRSRRSSVEQSPTSSVLPVPVPKCGGGGHGNNKMAAVRDVHDGEPSSPDIKRRRANDAGGYHAVNGSYVRRQSMDSSPATTERAPRTLMQSYARIPLPEIGHLTRSQSGPMPPPLRPAALWLEQDAQNRRHSCFDESLRLPPLQTAVPPAPSRVLGTDSRRVSLPMTGASAFREGQASKAVSSDKVIMSIPLQRKMSILASICQLVPPRGADDVPDGARGAFIAVEGPNARLLHDVGCAIERELLACDEFDLKVWRNESSGRDATATGPSQPLHRADGRLADSLEPYFKEILRWQNTSKEIRRHITGGNSPPEKNPAARGSAAKVHVALAREGFSLTVSDRYACAMPILDTYSPSDHWQWMATMWRGTVSPDLVVHVMPSEDEGSGAGRSVELLEHMGLLAVRLPAAKSLDEGVERRIRFEVKEWMRAASFREALPNAWRLAPVS